MSKNPIIAIVQFQTIDGERHSGIHESKWTNELLSHYKLKEDIEDYVSFLKLKTIYDLFGFIDIIIKPTDNHILNIEDLYYTSDYVYQAIFKCPVPTDNSTHQTLVNESNKLGTLMLGEKHIVDGNMILIKRSIINNNFYYEDISFDDITQIIKHQFLHQAVIVKPDNSIDNSQYIYNPLEINFGQSHLDNSRYYEFKFLEYRLFFHIDIKAEQTEQNFNKIASVIYGRRVYGNVLISLTDNSDSSPINFDIDADLLNMIYMVCLYNKVNKCEIDKKKYARKMELNNKDIEDYDPTKHTDFNHNGFPEVTLCPNFFYIIKNEYICIPKEFNDNNIDIFNLYDKSIFDN